MALYELRYYNLDETIIIEKGVVTYSNDKMRFNIGNLITEKEIKWLEVYYLDKEIKRCLLQKLIISILTYLLGILLVMKELLI